MNPATRFCLLAGLLSWSCASHAECPAYSDQRLTTISQSLAQLVDAVNASAGLVREVSLPAPPGLHELLADESETTLEAMCDLLTRYPSLESMLETSAAELRDNGVLDWLAQVSTPGDSTEATSFPCLTTGQFTGIRTATLALETSVAVANGFCKSALCSPAGACVAACTIAGAIEYSLPVFRWGMFSDLQFCMSNHTTEMDDWCDDALGCGNSRGVGTPTLAAIQQDVELNLLPALNTSTEQVAVQQVLESTSLDFLERLDFSYQQTSSVFSELQGISIRQQAFRQRLERLEIEASLADGLEQVDLMLPGQFGGRLLTVREVVSAAINDYQRTGLETGQALDFFRQGDVLFNGGKYDGAFDAYRNAYLEMTP